MKKVKFFFIGATLLLMVISVFATRPRFFSAALYANNGSTTYYPLASSGVFSNLTTNWNGSQATVTDLNGTSYGLYASTGFVGVYNPVYSLNW